MWTERKLQNQAAKILMLLGPKVRGAALDIFLLPHAEMKKLKARFFKKQTEPNVLSFREPLRFPHPERGRAARGEKKKYLGEIYLNREILEKSPERGTPLLLHGILHLSGYDHAKKKDGAEMEGLEDRILTRLGAA